MPFEVVMPRLGWNMEKGTLVKWLKEEGEYVQAGEPLFVVEADKANQEVEALESGVLHIPSDSPRPGTEVPVGTLLAYLLQPDEADAVPRRVIKAPFRPVAGEFLSQPAVPAPPEVGRAGPARSETVVRPKISPRALTNSLGTQNNSLRASTSSNCNCPVLLSMNAVCI